VQMPGTPVSYNNLRMKKIIVRYHDKRNYDKKFVVQFIAWATRSSIVLQQFLHCIERLLRTRRCPMAQLQLDYSTSTADGHDAK